MEWISRFIIFLDPIEGFVDIGSLRKRRSGVIFRKESFINDGGYILNMKRMHRPFSVCVLGKDV